MENEDDFHIVLSVEDKTGDYTRHLGVVIASIVFNTNNKIYFHIFHDETLTEENRDNLKKLVMDNNQKIRFHFIKLNIDQDRLKAIKYLSIGTLYRIDIVKQLKNTKKAIYLDSDIVVSLDIKELFEIDINRYAVAGVKDPGTEKNSFLYMRHIPINIKKYFNAGVLIFNLEKIRKHYELKLQAENLLNKYPNDPFTDQSALNNIFQGDCLFIDKKFNFIPNGKSKCGEKKIWHFAGGYKPWQVRMYQVDKLYWEYLKKTPWGKDVNQLFEYYSRTVEPLDEALLTYPRGSTKKFFKNVIKRIFREMKEIRERL